MIKRFMGYFKGEKMAFIFFVLTLFSTILNVLEPYMNGRLVEALTNKNFAEMAKAAILIAIIATSYALIRYVANKTSVTLKTRIRKRIESDLCKKALEIKAKFLEDFKSGELTSITKENPEEFVENLADILMSAFSVLSAVAVAAYVAYLNIWCLFLYIAFFLVVFFYQNASLKKEKNNADKGKKEGDSGKSLVNQIFKGIADIKVLNMKDVILNKYLGILDTEIEAQKNQSTARFANRLFCNIAFEVYTFLFIILGVLLMTKDMMQIQTFITIYLYRSYMYSLVFAVAEIRSKIVEVRSLTDRMNKVLSIEDNKIEQFGEVDTPQSETHTIEFTNVSFAYGENYVLKSISLTVKQGEIIGIVGESGSAKTTVIKLASRLLEPIEGTIEVDGRNIYEYSQKGYTELVSLASQQPFVFAFTIRENLLMVKPNASETEMWKALEKAQIIGFVKSLEKGLDTIITESMNLSGGQLQRIALARLFLKNTPIIILDEATSALDNKTQDQITQVIKSESSNHIFIIIAHRIEAVKDAHRIVFMDKGSIADEGTHEELCQRNPDYLKLTTTRRHA